MGTDPWPQKQIGDLLTATLTKGVTLLLRLLAKIKRKGRQPPKMVGRGDLIQWGCHPLGRWGDPSSSTHRSDACGETRTRSSGGPTHVGASSCPPIQPCQLHPFLLVSVLLPAGWARGPPLCGTAHSSRRPPRPPASLPGLGSSWGSPLFSLFIRTQSWLLSPVYIEHHCIPGPALRRGRETCTSQAWTPDTFVCQ